MDDNCQSVEKWRNGQYTWLLCLLSKSLNFRHDLWIVFSLFHWTWQMIPSTQLFLYLKRSLLVAVFDLSSNGCESKYMHFLSIQLQSANCDTIHHSEILSRVHEYPIFIACRRVCLSDSNKPCPQVQYKIPSGQDLARDGYWSLRKKMSQFRIIRFLIKIWMILLDLLNWIYWAHHFSVDRWSTIFVLG